MIDVVRQDENGREEARFDDPAVVGDASLDAADVGNGTRCLAFLDPYGDTVFNRLQIPVLAEEIAAVRDRTGDAELCRRLDALIAFLHTALDEPHTYIRFLGD